MDKDTTAFLKHKVANALMKRHGWDRNDPTHKLEFDPENPHSQYSMAYDDADVAVETFIGALLDLDGVTPEPSEDVASSAPDSIVDIGDPEEEERHHSTNPTISKSASVFIFMDSGMGNATYVGDVRDWLDAVDEAGIPDSTEVEGTLHLSYDVEPVQILADKDVLSDESYLLLTDPTPRKS